MFPKILQRVLLSESITSKSHHRGKGRYSAKTDFQIWVNFSMLRCARNAGGSISSNCSNILMFPRCWLHSSTVRAESCVLCKQRKGPGLHPPGGRASRDSEQTLSIWECQVLVLGCGGPASLHRNMLGRWVWLSLVWPASIIPSGCKCASGGLQNC